MHPMWMYDLLEREIANDRLRTAGYHSKIARRRRHLTERFRNALGRK